MSKQYSSSSGSRISCACVGQWSPLYMVSSWPEGRWHCRMLKLGLEPSYRTQSGTHVYSGTGRMVYSLAERLALNKQHQI